MIQVYNKKIRYWFTLQVFEYFTIGDVEIIIDFSKNYHRVHSEITTCPATGGELHRV